MPVYSHSRIGTFENCPQQYKLKYIDRIQPPEGKTGVEAFLGSRVHEVLEKLYKELILAKLNPLEDLLAFYEAQWDRNWSDDTVAIVKKTFTQEHYRQAGRNAITAYYERHHPFNQSKTISTEAFINFKVGEYTLQGFIDRLCHNGRGGYEIHDYKTSGSLPGQDKFDSDRQLALYQIGIQDKFRDVKDVKLVWHYLLFDKQIVSTRTPAQLKDLRKEVVSLIKTIEKETRFEPRESALCDWCDFPEYCPAKKHEFALQELPPNKYRKEKGVALVNKYASIKARMKELKQRQNALQLELQLVEDAAILYAQEKNLSKIVGSECSLAVTSEKVLAFPLSGDERRAEFEACVRKVGIWDDASILNVNRLEKLLESEALDEKTKKKLLRFAEARNETSVRLVKKKNGEERP